MKFIHFVASPAGRVIRFLAGAALVLVGLLWLRGPVGTIVAVVGLIPLLAATFDLCLLAPLFKLPLDGRAIREQH